MKCTECGVDNEAGARFCADCGATLGKEDKTLVIGGDEGGAASATLSLSGGESFTLKEGETLVGRKDESVAVDIDLTPFDKDKYCSRKHCIFTFEDGKLFVTDLSSNGTFVQDKRLESKAKTEVKNGAKIRFMKVEGKIAIG